MQFPIFIGLHRSSFLAAAIGAAHLLAASALLFVPWDAPVRFLVLGAVVVSSIWAWRRRLPAVQGLRLLDDGRLECRLAGQEGYVEADLRGGATVHPWLTVLTVEAEGHRVTVVALPDSMAAEDFRRLRVWLRWRADFSGAQDGA